MTLVTAITQTPSRMAKDCSTLQHAAAHCNTPTLCNTLQHAATCCNTLQHTARTKNSSCMQHTARTKNSSCMTTKTIWCGHLRSGVLQCVAMCCCSVLLQCVVAHSIEIKSKPDLELQRTAAHCNTLQHTANTLQHTATHCNTQQHTATHCKK